MHSKFAKRALLLAGGFGSRLKPLTDRIPKCLVPIGEKALLEYWLEHLFEPSAEGRIERVLINTHYLPQAVEAFIEKSPWHHHIDIVHEAHLLGTAGTLRTNRAWFGDEPFLLAHADNLTNFDLAAFQARFASRPPTCVGTMMTFLTETPSSCGIAEVNDFGVLAGYHEKVVNPPGNLANAAVFLLDARIHDQLATHEDDSDFCGQSVPRLIGQLNCFHNSTYHRDIGTPEAYAQAQVDVRTGRFLPRQRS